jgi:hypothetical protein
MFCPFGVFDEITVVSVGETDMSCTDFENLASEESSCNMAKFLEDTFEEAECEGKTNCQLDFGAGLAADDLPGPPCLGLKQGNAMFIVSKCIGSEIEFESIGLTIERTDLSTFVVFLDILICLAFICNTAHIRRYITLEEHDIDIQNVQVTDFAVRIKNLPDAEEYNSLNQLKAMLSLHIKDVIGKEDPVISSLPFSEKSTQIVNIHFA